MQLQTIMTVQQNRMMQVIVLQSETCSKKEIPLLIRLWKACLPTLKMKKIKKQEMQVGKYPLPSFIGRSNFFREV